jgi:hypothetical protein
MGVLLPFALFVVSVSADCYMHNPRGSNDRLNEQAANRNNGDRLFDSQNNNRGGYNVGDKGKDAFSESSRAQEPGSVFASELNEDQYSMIFYESSILGIEWTAQHGCGGSELGGPSSPQDDPNHLNCNMVLQYMCNTDPAIVGNNEFALNVELKDGRNTNTPDTAGSYAEVTSGTAKTTNDNNGRGRHESEGWYFECQRRSRNRGLFLADQKLLGDDMTRTRQNPNGNRRGLECPEERDYYPHWMPTPWIDIAYLTDQVEDCVTTDTKTIGAYGVLANSGNVKEVGKCTYYGTDTTTRENAWDALTPERCNNLTVNGATGVQWLTWSHAVAAPVCKKGEWSRSNHLGNGVKNEPLQYNWTLPAITALGKYVKLNNAGTGASRIAKCVLRVRYNITTDDYDPRLTNSSQNENVELGIVSPVEENPTVDIGLTPIQGLRLAINTNQFGRTFQDRSHTFYVKERPAGPACTTGKLWNLNVRGKRGNIVQTFPSVEYDFQPNQLEITSNDCIHIQWTGSNTHNNGNPAGDGQAGDAGEGTGGTDRNNIVCLADRSRNYPVAVDLPLHNNSCMFSTGNANFWVPGTGTGYMGVSTFVQTSTLLDAALYLGSSGYYKNTAEAAAATTTTQLNELLNNAPASLVGGVIMKPLRARTLHYMCTRNNNFSNRSQKGSIMVV